MPVKRRAGKSRRWRITPEAVRRWRKVRPGGFHFGPPAAFIEDVELGEHVGIPALVAWPLGELDAIREALEEAAGCR